MERLVGANPPYHHPVFVLSQHKHSSFEMEGGTSFSFVNDGIESALKQAFAAAKGNYWRPMSVWVKSPAPD